MESLKLKVDVLPQVWNSRANVDEDCRRSDQNE